MIADLLHALSLATDRFAAVAAEIAWKAAALCLATWILHLVIGRNRLLARSAFWHAALLGLVLLPPAVLFLPRTPMSAWLLENRPQAPAAADSGIAASHVSEMIPIADRPGPAGTGWHDESDQPLPSPSIAALARPELASDAAAPATLRSRPEPQFATIALVAGSAAYILVALVLIARLALSLIAVRVLCRQGAIVANTAWQDGLEKWHSRLGLSRPVFLRRSPRVSVPLVAGWFRPVIVLPEALAESADRQAIDAVLLHELAHAGRSDYAWNLLLQVATAIYWPHPFVWLAGRHVRQVREDVCDALCIHWMGDARAYCAILVEVAAGLVRRPLAALGMSMTGRTKLSRRLSRIERSRGSDRFVLSRPARGAMALFALVAVGTLASAQLSAGADRRDPQRAGEVDDSAPANVTGRGDARDADSRPRPNDRQAVRGSDGLVATDEADAEPAEARSNGQHVFRVATMKVMRGKFQMTTTQPATLVPFEAISLYTRHGGTVSKALVEAGDKVKKGEVLATLDAPDIETELAEKEVALAQSEAAQVQAKVAVEVAEATVQTHAAKLKEAQADVERAAAAEKYAKTQFERFKKLFETKSIDERLLDEKDAQLVNADSAHQAAKAKFEFAAAELASSKVDVRLAQAGLTPAKLRVAAAKAELSRSRAKSQDEYRQIKSPIDGVVLEKNIETGTFIKPGEGKPQFRVVGAGLIAAVTEVPELFSTQIERGQPASLRFDALKGRTVAAKVSRVAYALDPTTRTLRVEIALPNGDGRLKIGMFGVATIVIEEIDDALSIPDSALAGTVDDERVCLRVIDGKCVSTAVKIGLDNGKQAQVAEGLHEQDEVVVDVRRLKKNFGGKLPPDGTLVEGIPPKKK